MIVWDGGNNDTPFIKPDLHIVVVDPHRPGPRAALPPGRDEPAHGRRLRREQGRQRAAGGHRRGARLDPRRTTRSAKVVLAASPFHVEGDAATRSRGKRVLAIEDGPTLTHGEMTYGAAVLAAKANGAAELVDPRPFAVGSIAETFEEYPHVGDAAPGDGLRRQADGGAARDDRALATPSSS